MPQPEMSFKEESLNAFERALRKPRYNRSVPVNFVVPSKPIQPNSDCTRPSFEVYDARFEKKPLHQASHEVRMLQQIMYLLRLKRERKLRRQIKWRQFRVRLGFFFKVSTVLTLTLGGTLTYVKGWDWVVAHLNEWVKYAMRLM